MDATNEIDRYGIRGLEHSGSTRLNFATGGDDRVAPLHLPRVYGTQIDYSALVNAAGLAGPKFYLTDAGPSGKNYVKVNCNPTNGLIRIDLNACPIKVTLATHGWGTIPLVILPLGRLLLLGGTAAINFDWTGAIYTGTQVSQVASVTGNAAFGSAPATSTTLSSTIVDWMASAAMDTEVAGNSGFIGNFVTPTAFDYTTRTLTGTAKNLNFSLALTAGDTSLTAMIAYMTGIIYLRVLWLGDYAATGGTVSNWT